MSDYTGINSEAYLKIHWRIWKSWLRMNRIRNKTENNVRTYVQKMTGSRRICPPRLNSAIQHILLNNSKLQKEKSGQTLVFKGLSRLVEPAGVEPASKRSIHRLSTCLFCGWFSTNQRTQTPKS
jgi:hypothetical protein